MAEPEKALPLTLATGMRELTWIYVPARGIAMVADAIAVLLADNPMQATLRQIGVPLPPWLYLLPLGARLADADMADADVLDAVSSGALANDKLWNLRPTMGPCSSSVHFGRAP